MTKPIKMALVVLWFFGTMANGQDIGDLIREGKMTEAKALLTKIEKENRSQESILFLRGLLSTQGDSAEYYYKAYLNKNPNGRFSDEALFRVGQMKYAQALYRAAQNCFDQILHTHPLSPLKMKCLYWSGMCYSAVGQKDSAQVLFEQLNREFPSSELKDAIPKELTVSQPSSASVTSVQTTPSEKKEPVKSAPPTYSVQIGAFSNQNNALIRKAFFEKEGYSVYLKSKHRDNAQFYLVWIGSFPSWEEAKKFGESIKTKYGTSYTLVSE
jgi:cell division septation protein DedD